MDAEREDRERGKVVRRDMRLPRGCGEDVIERNDGQGLHLCA